MIAIVNGGVLFFAVLNETYRDEMLKANACAATLFGRTVDFRFPTRFARRESDHDQCDSSLESSPASANWPASVSWPASPDGRDLPWRHKRPRLRARPFSVGPGAGPRRHPRLGLKGDLRGGGGGEEGDGWGGAEIEAGEGAGWGEVGRFRQAGARRRGDRDRQSVQPRRHGHRRHRLGAEPRHQLRPL